MPYAADRSGRWSLDPAVLEAQCYTDRFSFQPGESVRIHATTTAPSGTIEIEIVRDLPDPAVVHTVSHVQCGAYDAPERAYSDGCGWPVCYTLPVPSEWRTGFYLIKCRAADDLGNEFVAEHFFVLRRAAHVLPHADLVVVLATNTWTAYNECVVHPLAAINAIEYPLLTLTDHHCLIAASAGATTTKVSKHQPPLASA